MAIYPVLLCGGAGSRLWPLSREAYPKHLIPLLGNKTLFQATLERVQAIADIQAPIIVSNEQQRFMVAEQAQALDIAPAAIILEPCARNTAAAIAAAAFYAPKDAILLILPADHVVPDSEAFAGLVKAAEPLAKEGYLVTFGIEPTHAHTGYGYIKKAGAIDERAYQIATFVEKPDKKTAQAYVESGFVWNSGMFLFTAHAYLKALGKFEPTIYQAVKEAVLQAHKDLDFTRLSLASFEKSPDIAVDVAVMERTDKGAVLPFKGKWSDVGSWDSLAEVCEPDTDGNVLVGDVLNLDSHNCYLRSNQRLLAAIGLNNLIVVDTADAVLVADMTQAQKVKQIVQTLKADGRGERLHHLTEYRPWGHHQLLLEAPQFQVRLVTVKAGQHISLQRHARRSEHWVVLKGVATILTDEGLTTLKPEESFYVPKGLKHQINNRGHEPLQFIEVQIGACFKEDDIERFE